VRRAERSGFTLIEVLVALAIVSIALLAALRAAGQGATSAEELRMRTLAAWIAQDALTEHRARGAWLALGISRGTVRQAGIDFAWREDVTPTPNSAFRRVDVSVYRRGDESSSLARLTGFVVQPPGSPR
jgi:general secretion pathway protein I